MDRKEQMGGNRRRAEPSKACLLRFLLDSAQHSFPQVWGRVLRNEGFQNRRERMTVLGFMTGSEGENSSFYHLPWGRGILVSVTHFSGLRRKETEGQDKIRDRLLLGPSYVLWSKVFSIPKHYNLKYHFLSPSNF